MPANKRDTVRFEQSLGQEDHARLHHHAKRLGRAAGDIVRQVVFEQLNVLDEQETFARANKAAREKKPLLVPVHKGPAPQGLGIDVKSPFTDFLDGVKAEVTKTPVKVPAKIEKSFNRYSEYVEGSENDGDRNMRMEDVLTDMKTRGTEEEAAAAYEQFLERFEARTLAKKTSKIVDIDPSIPVFGDIS